MSPCRSGVSSACNSRNVYDFPSGLFILGGICQHVESDLSTPSGSISRLNVGGIYCQTKGFAIL